jgi:hypothetical protein
MPAEQRHRNRAVFGERDDRRLGVLVVEQWAERTDQDAAGAQPDNRGSGGEQPGDMRHKAIVTLVPVARVMARPVKARFRQQVAHSSPKRSAARTQHQDRSATRQIAVHPPASPRQTKAIAKYGTFAGSIVWRDPLVRQGGALDINRLVAQTEFVETRRSSRSDGRS